MISKLLFKVNAYLIYPKLIMFCMRLKEDSRIGLTYSNYPYPKSFVNNALIINTANAK